MGNGIHFSIHPAIGIARIGNSNEFFVAPESVGAIPPPDAKFKDQNGRILRQGALFHVFRHDSHGTREVIVGKDVKIAWRVHAANRKAAWYAVDEPMDLNPYLVPMAPFRNASFRPRSDLVIDAGSVPISGMKAGPVPMSGKFAGTDVRLGELRTDEKGRLLVLSGKGLSGSLDGSPAKDDSNNDGWHDDIADGPVRATITYGGGDYEADPAYIVVTPPNYGQGIQPVVSMLDVLEDLFHHGQPPAPVIFERDIYPILERLVRCQWVNEGIYMLVGAFSPSDFTDAKLKKILGDPSNRARLARERVFHWFRNPSGTKRRGELLPPFYGDADDFLAEAAYDLSITRRQFECLRLWADGQFVSCPTLPQFQLAEDLDRAPLADCLGGPFSPGVDLPWILRSPLMWDRNFRLKLLPEGTAPRDDFGDVMQRNVCLRPGGPLDGAGPGSITRWLGVPWQTDAAACPSGNSPLKPFLPLPSFWAARVPNSVLTEPAYHMAIDNRIADHRRTMHFSRRHSWWRDIDQGFDARINANVTRWANLGIVAPRPGKPPLPETIWVEGERGLYNEDDDPTVLQARIAEGISDPTP